MRPDVRRFAVVAWSAGIAALLLGASPGAAAQDPPTAPLAGAHPYDGVYSSDSDSSTFVSVKVRQWSEGQYEMHVHGDHRFECVGFLVDSAFVGVVRAVGADGRVTGGADYGVLRLDFHGDGTVRSQLEIKDKGAQPATLWRRITVIEEEGSVRRPPPLLVDDPPLGQYVYVDELPVATKRFPPVYPGAARAQGVEGTVVLQVLVRKDGTVGHWVVTRSIPALDGAAVDAVARWRFKPARREGRTVPYWVSVPFTFSLH